MKLPLRPLAFACALACAALPVSSQVNSNNSPFNNGGDVIFFYSSPSSGFSSTAFPPDLSGDLYWRVHTGQAFMADVDPGRGEVMEIDGYYESLYDTDWSTTPSFYIRSHGPAWFDAVDDVYEPAFFQLGLTTESIVMIGSSGFGNPCTVAPSLCSPSGGTCPPPGLVNGYLVDLAFGSTPGTGIVLPADGTPASDMASTWFVHGGMTASGGACGLGDYDLQDAHSTDESQVSLMGGGSNPFGGSQLAGLGPMPELVSSMAEGHVTWRGNIVQPVADSGAGVEVGNLGGGAMNGRQLSLTPLSDGGAPTLGVELRDLAGTLTPSLAVCAASLSPINLPGVSALGGNLLIQPDPVFDASSLVWQGPVAQLALGFTLEGGFVGVQVPVPSEVPVGGYYYLQGATVCMSTFAINSSNRICVCVTP
ncbi:MAG: hypothetical protein AAF682_26295 [Planctomycetota bacterium]